MGTNPPEIFFSKSGGVDKCSTPPSKIQGGLRPPQPPPCLAPLTHGQLNYLLINIYLLLFIIIIIYLLLFICIGVINIIYMYLYIILQVRRRSSVRCIACDSANWTSTYTC